MSAVRLIVFSRDGRLLVDATSGNMNVDENDNFKSVLSILEPISSSESTFIYTINLGQYNIDISFDCGLYVFSITSSKIKSSLLSYNPIFSYSALLFFNDLISDLPSRDAIPNELIATFKSSIPFDPLPKIQKEMESLLIDSINYI